jgi:hypothetical protein
MSTSLREVATPTALSNIRDFIKKYSSLPDAFVNDFYNIANDDENNNDYDTIINFDIVVKWLNNTKSNLKRMLIENFKKNIDFVIEKINFKNKNNRGNHVNVIKITPICFKKLCMMSKT